MPAPAQCTTARPTPGDSALAARLRRELEGEVLFDRFSRGRYSTDASIYQIEPLGVVVPKTAQDVVRTIQIAGEAGVALLPRGGGTSQCGQTVGAAIVVDVSKHLNRLLELDLAQQRVTVEPGLVLDKLNGALASHGLSFPVDISTGSRATLGGMAGNNSCGARSLAYGTMRDNVHAIRAILADGSELDFGPLEATAKGNGRLAALSDQLLALGRREAAEIAERFPKLMRRVGGYNIDALAGNAPVNLAHLLVGSEGTLAFSSALTLDLKPIPPHKTLGICHFPTFYQAMDSSTQPYRGKLGPTAVELVDRTMIELARDIPLFRPTIEAFVQGEPAALLLVEFAGEDADTQTSQAGRAGRVDGRAGLSGRRGGGARPGCFQKAVWEVRKSGLNIMMSMKGEGKPISFIEDCAVAAGGPGRLHRAPDPGLPRNTAPRAPGTPMPRSAACMSVRCST